MRAIILALLLGLAVTSAVKADTPAIVSAWADAITDNRMDDWMALHTAGAVMIDLGNTYDTQRRIRGWGRHHAVLVRGVFTPTETLLSREDCVIWLADYRDRFMRATFAIAKHLKDGRIAHIRIDRDSADALARQGCVGD
jgi:hypothetical protein